MEVDKIMEHICIKPTLVCNCNCPTCYERQELYKNIKKHEYNELTLNDWENVFKDLKNMCDNCKITISGGEPLLYKDILPLVNIAHKYSNNITLNTNAILLNSDTTKKLIDNGVNTFLTSFMDYNVSDYMKYRGISNKKLYNLACNNVINLNKIINHNNIKSINVIILTKDRLLNLDKILLMCKVYNFTFVSLNFLEGKYGLENEYRIDNATLLKFENEVIPKLEKYKDYMHKILNILKSQTYIDNNFYRNNDLLKCNILAIFVLYLIMVMFINAM